MKNVKWGEYELSELFEINSSKRIYHANKISKIYNHQSRETLPYVVRTTLKNGIRGYINEDEKYANEGTTLSFAQDTFSVFFQKQKYFTGNKVKVLKPKFKNSSEKVMNYLTASFQKALNNCTWGLGSTVDTIKQTKISLPTKNGEIDFDFMESFIADLEAENIARVKDYLVENNLENCVLTAKEKQLLEDFENGKIEWGEFNVEKLFGKSTRGRRLKSSDRVSGELPFVTAGEADDGISAFVGNDIIVFPQNTTTIDMFGSAKYRNYEYGGDDHITVVHTQNLAKFASIFTTTALHKSAYTGEFHYGKNFYAKDADELNIKLPTKDNQPDYEKMEILISAVQKLVIKDVVSYVEEKLHKIL